MRPHEIRGDLFFLSLRKTWGASSNSLPAGQQAGYPGQLPVRPPLAELPLCRAK